MREEARRGSSHTLQLLDNCRPNKKRSALQVNTSLAAILLPQQEGEWLSSSPSSSLANEKQSQLSQWEATIFWTPVDFLFIIPSQLLCKWVLLFFFLWTYLWFCCNLLVPNCNSLLLLNKIWKYVWQEKIST